MASREEERNRRIRKITSKDIEPGKELQEVTQAQNEISGINSELQNNLAMEQSEAQARNNNNNILRQAAEIGLMGAAGGAIVQQVGNFNPTTQQLLQKYGIRPGPPVNKVETKTTNQNFRSNTGGNTRIENTTNKRVFSCPLRLLPILRGSIFSENVLVAVSILLIILLAERFRFHSLFLYSFF